MEQINVSIIADKRQLLEKFGVLLGKRIFKVSKANCKLDYFEHKRKIEEVNGITTNRPVVRYMVVPIDITSVEIDKDIDGGYEIILNRGLTDINGVKIEVNCPIDNPILTRKVTTDVLAEALNDKNKTNIFFSSADAVNSEINRLNEKEEGRIKALLEDLGKQKALIEQTITANNNLVSEYGRQLSLGDRDAEVNISIEA